MGGDGSIRSVNRNRLFLLVFAYAFSWVMAMMGLLAPGPEVVNNAAFIVIFPLTFVANTFVPILTLTTGTTGQSKKDLEFALGEADLVARVHRGPLEMALRPLDPADAPFHVRVYFRPRVRRPSHMLVGVVAAGFEASRHRTIPTGHFSVHILQHTW